MERIGKERVISDYVAGMTDRFALDEFKRLFEPYERI
jgi:dGTPase